MKVTTPDQMLTSASIGGFTPTTRPMGPNGHWINTIWLPPKWVIGFVPFKKKKKSKLHNIGAS